MGLLEDKKSAAALIIRKMRGSDYDSMKESNEQVRHVATNEQGDEVDSSMGLKAAVDDMMSAVEAKSASNFKSALESFLEMWLDQRDSEEDND